MIFENILKEVLKEQIGQLCEDKDFNLKVANDVLFTNFKNKDLCMVIKTGSATLSGVQDILSTNSPLTITIKVETSRLQDALNLVNDYVQQVNGVFYEILENDGDVAIHNINDQTIPSGFKQTGTIFKLGFNTPTVIGSPQTELIKVDDTKISTYTSIFLLTGNAYFTDLQPNENKYFVFDSGKIEKALIEGISNYVENETFNYQSTTTANPLGLDTYTGRQHTISFTIWAKNNDFCNEIKSLKENKVYKFQKGNEEPFNIIITSVNYQETNGVGQYTISLKETANNG